MRMRLLTNGVRQVDKSRVVRALREADCESLVQIDFVGD